MPQTQASFAPAAAALALPDLARAALFFDVDGTLLEIRPEPRDVLSDGDLRTLLERLDAASRAAIRMAGGGDPRRHHPQALQL